MGLSQQKSPRDAKADDSQSRPTLRVSIPSGHDLRLVLIGKTGAGKSATGNNIIGSKVFDEMKAWGSATQVCRLRKTVINGTKIQVVDTPGVVDTDRTDDVVREEITKCIVMSHPGPNAVIMVIRGDVRFTEEEYHAYKLLKEMFGEDVVNYMIIVFTHSDPTDRANEDMLKNVPQNLQHVLEEVGNRHVFFENETKDNIVFNKQVSQLIEMVVALKSRPRKPFFTNEAIKEADDRVDKEIQNVMAKFKVEKKEAEEKLFMEIENDDDEIRRVLAEVQARIFMIAMMSKVFAQIEEDEKRAKGICSVM